MTNVLILMQIGLCRMAQTNRLPHPTACTVFDIRNENPGYRNQKVLLCVVGELIAHGCHGCVRLIYFCLVFGVAVECVAIVLP